MTIYQVAVSTEPEIVCPPWCTVSKQEHLEDLASWEGRLVHASGFMALGANARAEIAGSTLADGTPDPEDPIGLMIDDAWMSLDDAAQLARDLLALVESAGGGSSLAARLARG